MSIATNPLPRGGERGGRPCQCRRPARASPHAVPFQSKKQAAIFSNNSAKAFTLSYVVRIMNRIAKALFVLLAATSVIGLGGAQECQAQTGVHTLVLVGNGGQIVKVLGVYSSYTQAANAGVQWHQQNPKDNRLWNVIKGHVSSSSAPQATPQTDPNSATAIYNRLKQLYQSAKEWADWGKSQSRLSTSQLGQINAAIDAFNNELATAQRGPFRSNFLNISRLPRVSAPVATPAPTPRVTRFIISYRQKGTVTWIQYKVVTNTTVAAVKNYVAQLARSNPRFDVIYTPG